MVTSFQGAGVACKGRLFAAICITSANCGDGAVCSFRWLLDALSSRGLQQFLTKLLVSTPLRKVFVKSVVVQYTIESVIWLVRSGCAFPTGFATAFAGQVGFLFRHIKHILTTHSAPGQAGE